MIPEFDDENKSIVLYNPQGQKIRRIALHQEDPAADLLLPLPKRETRLSHYNWIAPELALLREHFCRGCSYRRKLYHPLFPLAGQLYSTAHFRSHRAHDDRVLYPLL